MALNKQKGNMYPYITHTWNTIKGKCPHECLYCYMKRWKQPELHFDENELKTNLGKDNFIFVGSSCDMWAEEIRKEWINKTLIRCRESDQVLYRNRYLFQTKNPKRFLLYQNSFPSNTILATTIETNRISLKRENKYKVSNAPDVNERIIFMEMLKHKKFELMISIEPIVDFDLNDFIDRINLIRPRYISIGADSQKHKLPEPSSNKVWDLITYLTPKYHVIIKKNLRKF